MFKGFYITSTKETNVFYVHTSYENTPFRLEMKLMTVVTVSEIIFM